MEYSWAKNLYDRDGGCYEDCILVFCGQNTILKFDSPVELEQFAQDILRSLKEMWE